MATLPIGFMMMLGVLFFAVDRNSWPLFLNAHAIIVVVFGTLAVLILGTPSGTLKALLRSLRGLFSRSTSISDHWVEFQSLAKDRSKKVESSNALINSAQNFWESGVSNELFIVMLSQKRHDLENEDFDTVHALRNLAKYPPALGMTGTVVGLVGLFSNLGASNKAGLGPALALAMTATFFGLVLANALITPLADRLHLHYIWRKRVYGEVYQVLLLINRGESLELIDVDHGKKEAAA